MSDTSPYPRRVIEAVAAALGGAVAALAVTSLVVTNGTFTNLTVTGSTTLPGATTSTYGTFTTGNLTSTSTFSAQGTASFIGLATFQNLTATGSINLGTASASTLTVGSGSAIDKIVRATASLDPDTIGAGQSTTTAVTVTGASVGDDCKVTVTAGDLWSTTSTVVASCRISATSVCTVNLYNATGTASFNAGASTIACLAQSY